jgi:hypothetical protein
MQHYIYLTPRYIATPHKTHVQPAISTNLIGVRETTHTRHDTEDVVVDSVADEVPGGGSWDESGSPWSLTSEIRWVVGETHNVGGVVDAGIVKST